MSKLRTIASRVLAGDEPTPSEAKSLAGSVLRSVGTPLPQTPDNGSRLLNMIATAVKPETIVSRAGTAEGVTLRLSDGRDILVRRQRVKGDLDAYVAELV